MARESHPDAKPGDDMITSPEKQRQSLRNEDKKGGPILAGDETLLTENAEPFLTLTEADAIFELKAIPLYFPTSYSLVKPYVLGFEMNGLDAPSLSEVSIDNTWQPKAVRSES